MGPGDSGTLLTNGVLVTTFDIVFKFSPTGVVFDWTYYFVFTRGITVGPMVIQLDINFNYVTDVSLIPCRGAFYNPADGEVYFKNEGLDLFRLHTDPFDGGYDTVLTNIFQDADSKVCNSLDGAKMYDHLNGIVREYDFATGTILDTITLDLQHDLTWPRGYILAHTGTYFLTYAHPVVYAYDDNNGSFVSACTLPTQPNSVEMSICYTNGVFIVAADSGWVGTIWYVWTIDQGVPVELTSFTANVINNEVELSWITATETNNQGFDLQRKSGNGEFNSISFINGAGTTTETQAYSYTDKNLPAGNYVYRLKQIDFDGTFKYSKDVNVEVANLTTFILEQNYPNPFNPTTTIGFGIQNKSNVKITILNSIGEEVAVVLNEERESGFHQVEFNAANLPSGVYFYQIKAGDFMQTKKMILLK